MVEKLTKESIEKQGKENKKRLKKIIDKTNPLYCYLFITSQNASFSGFYVQCVVALVRAMLKSAPFMTACEEAIDIAQGNHEKLARYFAKGDDIEKIIFKENYEII